MYNEVALLERLRGTPGICQLYDYGVCATSAALVMKRYACSLRTWRDCLPRDPFEQVRLYLRVFADVLAKVKVNRRRCESKLCVSALGPSWAVL